MGGGSSKHRGAEGGGQAKKKGILTLYFHFQASDAHLPPPPPTAEAPAAETEAVPQGPFDVAISGTSEDAALAEFIKGAYNKGVVLTFWLAVQGLDLLKVFVNIFRCV